MGQKKAAHKMIQQMESQMSQKKRKKKKSLSAH